MLGYEGDGNVRIEKQVELMKKEKIMKDDVVDEREMRRGKRKERKIWGKKESVIVGDLMMGKELKMMVDVGQIDEIEVMEK